MSSHLSTFQEWKTAKLSELRKIRGVCLDIDDTLSTSGKLTAEAYSALWKLYAAGLWVVPVTGRPAGWCDHIARFWPVNAVVGENGAFVFFMENGIRRRMDTLSANREWAKKKEALAKKIEKTFSQVRWASDQAYRENDLAIDICEDVSPWPSARVEALLQLCDQAGARAKVSSIHVNVWFGNYDKKIGFRQWLKRSPAVRRQKMQNLENWIYIGDSPNDEPMFEGFPYSVGVANIKKYAKQLRFPPTWVTREESGQGFVEFAGRLILAHR